MPVVLSLQTVVCSIFVFEDVTDTDNQVCASAVSENGMLFKYDKTTVLHTVGSLANSSYFTSAWSWFTDDIFDDEVENFVEQNSD